MLAKVFNYAFGAGETKSLPGGRFLRLLSVSSPVDVEFFDESGTSYGICEGVTTGFAMAFYPADIGKNAPLISFGKVRITSALAQTVQVIISRQPVSFDALSGNVTATVVKASSNSDDADTVIAAVGTLTIAADTTRRAVVISSDPGNTGAVLRVSKTGGARGEFLQAGMSVIVNTTDSIKVYNPDAAITANVGVRYEKD